MRADEIIMLTKPVLKVSVGCHKYLRCFKLSCSSILAIIRIIINLLELK